ncbi:MAG: hypothetical protein AAGA08_13465 [Pseudomonadota bacterium]
MLITVTGIEVVQSIQDAANSVPLFALRPTLVRIYTSVSKVETIANISAEIEIRRKDGSLARYGTKYPLPVSGSGGLPTQSQRHSLNLSLNFVIPSGELTEGEIEIALAKAWPTTDPGKPVEIESSLDRNAPLFTVESPTSLRCHVIGLTTFDDVTRLPNEDSVLRIKRELSEILPVSNLHFSSETKEVPPEANPPYSSERTEDGRDLEWERKHNIICACLMASRVCDLENGRDPRTIYYGMVADDGSLRDAAVSNVGKKARPSIASAGPHGQQAHTYAVHEIGHVMTCLHPGHPVGTQVKNDADFPASYKGRISDETDEHFGWRAGAQGSLGEHLSYTDTFDFMSYATKTGISAINYRKVAQGLRDIEAFQPETKENGFVAVIGVYDKGKGTISGEIRHIYKTKYSIPKGEQSDKDVVIRVHRKNAKPQDFNIDLKFENSALSPNSGPFQITVPYKDDITKFELIIKRSPKDEKTYSYIREAIRSC